MSPWSLYYAQKKTVMKVTSVSARSSHNAQNIAIELQEKPSYPGDMNITHRYGVREDGSWLFSPVGTAPMFEYIESTEIVEETCISVGPSPKNNDGRATCFWHPNIKTVKRGDLGQYDCCPECEK